MIIKTLMTLVPNLIDIRNEFKLGIGWDKVPLRRANGNLEIGLRPEDAIKRISVHHSAVEGDIFGHERYHVLTKGEPGVAYHTYLKRDRRFLCNHPLALTWHTQSNNYDTLSVCIEGNFTKRNMTEVERANLNDFLFRLLKVYPHIPLDSVRGHWEWTSKRTTSCPGFDMVRVREDVYGIMQREQFEQSESYSKKIAYNIANEILWTYNLLQGKDENGNPVDAEKQEWAKRRLLQLEEPMRKLGFLQ